MRTRGAIVAGVVLLIGVAGVVWWIAAHRGGGRHARSAVAATGSAHGSASKAGKAVIDPRTQAPAELRGTVREKGGGPIAGAHVCSTWYAEHVDSAARREPVCATTDARGAYRLTGLVPATHDVSAWAPQHVAASWRPPKLAGRRAPVDPNDPDATDDDETLELAPGEVRDGIDLELAPGGVEVRGLVADISGGAIAGARVTLHSGSWWQSGAASTLTDADGRFTLWGEAGEARVAAEAEGYADGDAEAVAPAQAVEILLTPESTLAGIVVDADTRAPVADAAVEVGKSGESPFDWMGSEVVHTGADGRFRFDRLEPARYKPTASGRGAYGEAADSVLLGLGQHVDDVVIEVHPARVVRGTIMIDDGRAARPCKGGEVALHRDDPEAEERESAGDDGVVELTAVRPGRYRVEVECTSYVARERYDDVVVVDRDVDGLVWTVSGGGRVRGVVRTAEGAPVPDVSVMAEATGASARLARRWIDVRTEDDGSFELRGLRAGEYALRVWSDEHRAPEPPPKVTVVDGEVSHADIVLMASGEVAGAVVDEDGAPVAGADVRVTGGGMFRGGNSARSGEDGRFVVRGVEPGERRVIATRGWVDELRRPGTSDDDVQGEKVTVTAGKTATVRLVVERRRGVITGTVRDAQGAPVSDAWVVTSRESDAPGVLAGSAARATRWSWGRDDRPVITDVDGAFTVRGLSPGTYTVRAFRRGGGEAVGEHVAVGGTVALVIRATGTIGGTVVAAGGAPPEELTITVGDAASGFSRRESFYRTGGRFTLRDLPAGTFVVAAMGGGGRVTTDVTLAAGEQRTDLQLVLAANVTVRGRLVDLDSGAPVEGVEMSVAPRKGAGDARVFRLGDDGAGEQVSNAEGRFAIAHAPVGPAYLRGIPRDFMQSPYGFVQWPVDVAAGRELVDVGDVQVPRRRLSPGQPEGDLGLAFVQQPPGTEPAARELKVRMVRAGGPAAAAGVKVGDVVVAVDGHDVRGVRASLAWTLMSVPVGAKVTLGLARGDSVTVTAVPEP